MKRILLLVAVTAVAVLCTLSFVSCKENPKSNGDNKESEAISTPAFDSYSDYVEKKADIFSEFTTRLYGEKNLVQSAGNGLLTLSSADIEFLPLALLQDAERSGGSFSGNSKGCYGSNAKIADGNFTLEYTTYGGENEKITGNFDPKTSSLYCEKYKFGVVFASLEYAPFENGYKAQYVIFDDENENANVIRINFCDGTSGFSQFAAQSAEKLANIPDESFLSAEHILIREQNGEIFASIDGTAVE